MPAPIPFDRQEYWSQRFENESTFEWLMPWSVLYPRMQALDLLPPPTAATNTILNTTTISSATTATTALSSSPPSASSPLKILNLGCGNSELPLDLYRSGYPNVTSVDFVGSVVQRMKEHCEAAIGWHTSITSTEKADPQQQPCPLVFLEMDCLDMSVFGPESFDLCIDKSTSDAISCGDDDNYTKLRTLCHQVARLLPSGALWCVISYSRFRQYEWSEGLGAHLWTTERIEEVKVEAPEPAEGSRAKSVVHTPDVFQYLYVNRRR